MSTDTKLREYTLAGYGGATETMLLELLGEGSSYAAGKQRWFEVAIYVDEDGEYVVHTTGRTTHESETDRYRIVRTRSAFDVIELLTVRRVSQREAHATKGRATAPYVPVASLRALAQSADRDAKIREAYLELVA